VFGGYSSDFGSRDIVLNPTIIAGVEPSSTSPGNLPGVVNFDGIRQNTTVFSGFVVYGYDVTSRAAPGAKGADTYALYVRDSNNHLTVANNVIKAGRAGAGGHGKAGAPGASGATGSKGLASKECASASCGGESQPGGDGGENPGCSSAVGQPGARSAGDLDPQGYNSNAGGNGLGGNNGVYTSEGNPEWVNLCKYDCRVPQNMIGQDAQSGRNGDDGAGGSGCTQANGLIVDGRWVAATAQPGSPGGFGEGGGGGGAGGCVLNQNPSSCTVGNRVGDLGATGGGGGAGGCGGSQGMAGGSGGASFGLFLVLTSTTTSIPEVFGNIVIRGEAGAGGNGGYGGHGGVAGEGGEGGVSENPAWCAGFGGKGGQGGGGGSGGGGGGGCAGVSFGVAGNGIDAVTLGARNEFPTIGVPQAGAPGGAGGPSPSGGNADGRGGVAGAWGDVHGY
jgi:hypothetical protein